MAAAEGLYFVLFPAALLLIGAAAALLLGSLVHSYVDFIGQLRS